VDTKTSWGQEVKLALIDTSYRGDYEELIRRMYFPIVKAIILCYSPISVASYDRLTTNWGPLFAKELPDIPIVLVATKIDLRDDSETIERCQERHNRSPISAKEGEEKAKELGALGYFETSSLTHVGVGDAFRGAFDIFAEYYRNGGKMNHNRKLDKAKDNAKCVLL